VIPALWRPNVKAAKDTEGLLKVNRVRSITGVGIKRNKNEKIFIKKYIIYKNIWEKYIF